MAYCGIENAETSEALVSKLTSQVLKCIGSRGNRRELGPTFLEADQTRQDLDPVVQILVGRAAGLGRYPDTKPEQKEVVVRIVRIYQSWKEADDT